MRVAASLWSVEPTRVTAEMERLATAGVTAWHWDYSDGSLGPAGGFEPQAARAYARTLAHARTPSDARAQADARQANSRTQADAPARAETVASFATLAPAGDAWHEAHLMTREPLAHLDAWCEFCDLVAVHVEVPDARQAIERVIAAGRRAAVAISPGPPLPAWVEPSVDVLVMAVRPGHGGSAFDRAALDAVAALTAGAEYQAEGSLTNGRGAAETESRWPEAGRQVGADGGVTCALAQDLAHAGATWVVSGTDLLAAPDPASWLAAVAS